MSRDGDSGNGNGIARHATRLVMRREFTERGRDRGFMISVGISMVIVLVSVLIASLASNKNKTPSFTVAFAGPNAAQVQQAARADAPVLKVNLTSSVVTDQAAAEQQVKSGELDALVAANSVYVKDTLDPKLETVLQAARVQAAGVDIKSLALDPVALAPKDPQAAQRKGISIIAEIMLFAQLVGYCVWVAMGVVEEKSSRVIEVLLATVSPRALLTGKIVGVGALGLIQLALTVTVGVSVGAATGALHLTTAVWQTIGIVAVWFVIGYTFYASAYAAVASRVSRQEEMQTAIQPLNLLIMFPYFAAFAAVSNPDATWVRVLSLIPPFSALIQPVRIAGGDASWWEPIVAVGLMAALTFAIVSAGARVYENSVLRFGSKVPLRVAWTAGRRA